MYASISFDHYEHMKESYENLEIALNLISYSANGWMICEDKMHASWSASWVFQIPMVLAFLWALEFGNNIGSERSGL